MKKKTRAATAAAKMFDVIFTHVDLMYQNNTALNYFKHLKECVDAEVARRERIKLQIRNRKWKAKLTLNGK